MSLVANSTCFCESGRHTGSTLGLHEWFIRHWTANTPPSLLSIPVRRMALVWKTPKIVAFPSTSLYLAKLNNRISSWRLSSGSRSKRSRMHCLCLARPSSNDVAAWPFGQRRAGLSR